MLKTVGLLFLLILASSCSSFSQNYHDKQLNPVTAQSSQVYAMRSLASDNEQSFYKGLLSKTGSPERKRSGDLLQAVLDNAAKRAEPYVKSEAGRREFLITKNLLQMTVDYLKADRTCEPADRVRLYRGIRPRQLVRTQQGFLQPWSITNYEFVMNRTPIPAAQSKEVEQSPFADLEMKLTKVSTDSCAYCERNLDWELLVSAHSGVDSKLSPLISTTLEPSVAKNFANPELLVLDVCPERAITIFDKTVDGFATFPEAEVYIPLFILPEEVTTILTFSSTEPKFAIPAAISGNQTDLTKALRRRFFGKDLPFDVQYVTAISPKIPATDNGIPSILEYRRGQSVREIYDLILNRYTMNVDAKAWRDQAISFISHLPTNTKTCQYAYDNYIKAKIIDSAGNSKPSLYEQGGNPKRSFLFPLKNKIEKATFSNPEFKKVKEWQIGWNKRGEGLKEGTPGYEIWEKGNLLFDDYLSEFDNVEFRRQKLYEGYVDTCKKSN